MVHIRIFLSHLICTQFSLYRLSMMTRSDDELFLDLKQRWTIISLCASCSMFHHYHQNLPAWYRRASLQGGQDTITLDPQNTIQVCIVHIWSGKTKTLTGHISKLTLMKDRTHILVHGVQDDQPKKKAKQSSKGLSLSEFLPPPVNEIEAARDIPVLGAGVMQVTINIICINDDHSNKYCSN